MTATSVHPHRQPGALRPDVEHSDKIMPACNLEADALALRKAWGLYFLLALLPPLAMIGAIFYLLFTSASLMGPQVVEANSTLGWAWFLGGMIFIGLSLPASFFARRKLWAAYYEGGVVDAGNYVKGNLVVWAPLVVAGVLGFVGFALTFYVASLFTSVLAFVIFLALTPNGHAMTRPVGDEEDSGVYEEPK